MNRQKYHPEVRQVVRRAVEAGWTVEKTASGHIRFRPPDPTKPVVVHAGTPSEWRGIANLRADLRRSGLDVRSA